MKKAYRKTNKTTSPKCQISLQWEEVQGLLRTSLDTFAIEVGYLVAEALLEDEVAALCGKPHARSKTRMGYRHGRQAGYLVLAGQKLSVSRPRVRSSAGHELDLPPEKWTVG